MLYLTVAASVTALLAGDAAVGVANRAGVPAMSGVARNPNIEKLQAGYLFPEIGRRRNAYLEANPDTQPIISLGIGDTTMPVPDHILSGLVNGASALGTFALGELAERAGTSASLVVFGVVGTVAQLAWFKYRPQAMFVLRS